jgi:uncharacterized membrane protein
MAKDTLSYVVATFPTYGGAEFALARLQTAQIKRGNLAIIRRGDGTRLRISETHDWGLGKGALLGGLVTALIPGVGLAAGMLAGGIMAKLRDSGFPDSTLKEIGDRLTPNSSALVALVDPAQHDLTLQVLTRAGGTPIGGSLPADLDEQLAQDMATEQPEGDQAV